MALSTAPATMDAARRRRRRRHRTGRTKVRRAGEFASSYERGRFRLID